MRLIDADLLYTQLQKDEELARKRVLDTESFTPYPNNLNPSYTRYVAQMDERTRLKHMVADAPTIEPQRKIGRWIPKSESGCIIECSSCGERMTVLGDENPNFCPYCGSYNGGEQNETD